MRALPRLLTPANSALLGVTRSRISTEIRRGNWQRVAPGVVLTRPDEPTREDWADVGIALAGRGAAVTGWDAVRARGIGDSRPPSPLVRVLSPTAHNRVVGGVRIGRTSRPFTWRRQPLGAAMELTPLVSTPRAVVDTALDCAELSTVRALVSVALQRRLCSLDELIFEHRSAPRQGSQTLRVALADACDGARSAAEAVAARRLAAGAVPPFELNVPVVDELGTLLYEIDVLWRELRAGLEVDSRKHHFDDADWHRTLARHNKLTSYRIELVHWSPAAINRDGSGFVAEVAGWLRGRAAELGVALPAGHGVRRPPLGGRPPPLVVRRSP